MSIKQTVCSFNLQERLRKRHLVPYAHSLPQSDKPKLHCLALVNSVLHFDTGGECHLRAFSAVDVLLIDGTPEKAENTIDDTILLSVLAGNKIETNERTPQLSWVESVFHPIARSIFSDIGDLGDFRGRKLPQFLNNLRLVSRWTDFCEECHGKSCHAHRGEPVRGFKLIGCES
jgi:hypothetical protein